MAGFSVKGRTKLNMRFLLELHVLSVGSGPVLGSLMGGRTLFLMTGGLRFLLPHWLSSGVALSS